MKRSMPSYVARIIEVEEEELNETSGEDEESEAMWSGHWRQWVGEF